MPDRHGVRHDAGDMRHELSGGLLARSLDGIPMVDVPARDVHGAQLRLQVGPEPTSAPAVASHTVALPGHGGHLVLEVLSASHRVSVLDADGRCITSETVACAEGEAGAGRAGEPVPGEPLPGEHRWSFVTGAGAVGHGELWSARHHGEDAVRAAQREIADVLAASHDHVAVRFPGDDAALTVVSAAPTPLASPSERIKDPMTGQATTTRWATWHLYPGVDPHVVMTRTTITVAALDCA